MPARSVSNRYIPGVWEILGICSVSSAENPTITRAADNSEWTLFQRHNKRIVGLSATCLEVDREMFKTLLTHAHIW